MVRLLVVEPGYCPYIANFDSVPTAIKEVIEGECEILKPFGTAKIGLICSKDQSGMRYNRRITEEDDHVYGRFLICGLNGEKTIGLTKEQADRYPELDDDDLPIAKVRPRDERYGQRPRIWER